MSSARKMTMFGGDWRWPLTETMASSKTVPLSANNAVDSVVDCAQPKRLAQHAKSNKPSALLLRRLFFFGA
jgi:hypothetical protein